MKKKRPHVIDIWKKISKFATSLQTKDQKMMSKVGFLIAALFLTALTLLTLIRTNN